LLKFGPLIARKLRQRRSRPSDRWHLDEGKRMYLLRAVDHEGEILDVLVHRNQVRTRLLAGGKRIRTLGPSYIDDACETVAWCTFAFRPEKPTRSKGADGSNPLSSSSESLRLCPPAHAVRIYKTYRADAVQLISENPYRLARGLQAWAGNVLATSLSESGLGDDMAR
jgi:hypothetical protein